MTKSQILLQKKGYKITFAMSGNTVFATKGRESYYASSITALKKKVLSF